MAEGTVHPGGPGSALSMCINRSPHDHSPIKTDHPFNPPQTFLRTQLPALLNVYGRANLELDPLSGEGSDDPGAQPNCVCLTKFDRLINTLSLPAPASNVALWRTPDSIRHVQEYKAAWELVKECVPHANVPFDPTSADSLRALIPVSLQWAA